MIFEKKSIIPIIVPQTCFIDKYNNINSYVEMNPSINIEENGDVTILVRCVNYKKFKEKQFTMFNDYSNSIYYICNGKIIDGKIDVDTFEFKLVEYHYGTQIYPTYWKGIEDIRFIDKNNILVTVPELNISGNPSIFKANLNGSTITNFTSCNPNIIEKNWMPYYDNETHRVIYSLDPFFIKSIEDSNFEEVELSETNKSILKEGYHGSTNGISMNKYDRLFLIHVNKDISIHRWLLFNIITKEIKLSYEFTFFKNSYIEFTCSLTKYKEQIFISIGVNDDKAFIIETCYKDIMATFPNYKNDKRYPTIVTMLYDIRSMENNNIERNRKLDSFIDFSKKFMLTLPFPIIFFIDENKETYETIYNFRKKLNLLDKTYIFINNFKNTYFYKDLSRITDLQTQFHILNGEIEHETPLYIILNNNKFDCINKTIELNPFNASHLVWMDFGINHVAENTEHIFEWIDKIPDKIKQICINPYIENIEPKTYFENIYHNMAGGLFSGSIENMRKYSELFKNKTEEIYKDNWYQIDEAVMTMVHRDNPELFDLFYGDYQGIVSNYLTPLHNIDLILNGSQKCINMNKIKEAYHILCYCIPYFENNKEDKFLLLYISQHILVDYYSNNGYLLESVIEIINFLKNIHPERIQFLLDNNKNNINFYKNKEIIL